MSEVIRAAAKKWFYESFDCDLLEKMEKAGLIAQAEGFSISVMADLELDMEAAFDRVTAERDAALAKLNRALELLRGTHTGDLFGPDDWATVDAFLSTFENQESDHE